MFKHGKHRASIQFSFLGDAFGHQKGFSTGKTKVVFGSVLSRISEALAVSSIRIIPIPCVLSPPMYFPTNLSASLTRLSPGSIGFSCLEVKVSGITRFRMTPV